MHGQVLGPNVDHPHVRVQAGHPVQARLQDADQHASAVQRGAVAVVDDDRADDAAPGRHCGDHSEDDGDSDGCHGRVLVE